MTRTTGRHNERHAAAGNEAGAYLQFMIDHYDCLPKVCLESLSRLIMQHSWLAGIRVSHGRWQNYPQACPSCIETLHTISS